MKRTAILGIDLQNDFTSPSGTLFVQNADIDVVRIADFVRKQGSKIDYIALSLDSHQPIHIAHQIYWKDKEGNQPDLFSVIKTEDVQSGKWMPRYNKDLALTYLQQLEAKGDVCTIWPMHCILGTSGWAIDKAVTDSLSDWAINTGRSYGLFYKGYSQSTEHYSIFRAAVEWENEPETYLNTTLLDRLNTFDEVLLVGEAADYCVANSLNDILDECSELAKKIVVLTDCMSWINPENEKAKYIFEKAEKQGVRFTTTEQFS
ncbi:isochorismatase family protein [Dysgonomonas sp. 511]|uniref:isochorismatase family protein n=1 Tax=Dysgonomonas sp. 511 TaxID=2302930 RepID=UPI0013D479AC|nr:isochorismatase family protein [Dysgonomonas sp. 511]NDV79079.1 isochorismatase family protein [Dysgonomonas sp. 511]